MENKEIYIDGVDVSGCKSFYSKTKDCIQEDTVDIPCVDYPNCYYKQLKAKEQECERLKSALKKKTDEYNKLTVNYDAYVSMANKQLDQLKNERKLKQTLTEIKPILEFYANSKIGEEQPDGTYKYSGKYSGKYSESNDSVYIIYDPKPAREGLKKISECEVEND